MAVVVILLLLLLLADTTSRPQSAVRIEEIPPPTGRGSRGSGESTTSSSGPTTEIRSSVSWSLGLVVRETVLIVRLVLFSVRGRVVGVLGGGVVHIHIQIRIARLLVRLVCLGVCVIVTVLVRREARLGGIPVMVRSWS